MCMTRRCSFHPYCGCVTCYNLLDHAAAASIQKKVADMMVLVAHYQGEVAGVFHQMVDFELRRVLHEQGIKLYVWTVDEVSAVRAASSCIKTQERCRCA